MRANSSFHCGQVIYAFELGYLEDITWPLGDTNFIFSC